MFCTLFLCHYLQTILDSLPPSFERRLINSDTPADMVFVQPERLVRVQFSSGQCSVYFLLVALGAGTLYIVLCIVGRGLR
jgi:hypothetical protein